MVLNDIENPQVQSHAAAALVNFIEQCPKAVLAKYIDDIVFKLEDIFSMKLKEVGRYLLMYGLLQRYMRGDSGSHQVNFGSTLFSLHSSGDMSGWGNTQSLMMMIILCVFNNKS